MSKWPEWVQAELDAGRISEEELAGFDVFVGPSDVHLKAVRKFGMVFWLGETWWAWENQHDNRNFGDWTDEAPPLPREESIRQYRNLAAALSGQPTAEVERLKQRVGELEEAIRKIIAKADHPSMPQALKGDMGEYKRGYYSCWQAMSKEIRQALSDTPERGEGGGG